MSYRKFTDFGCARAAPAAVAANSADPVKCTRAAPAAIAANDETAAVAATAARTHPPERKNIALQLADIMALPVMPCTTCAKFKWGRRASCEHYRNLEDPRKGCRCIHYQGRVH